MQLNLDSPLLKSKKGMLISSSKFVSLLPSQDEVSKEDTKFSLHKESVSSQLN